MFGYKSDNNSKTTETPDKTIAEKIADEAGKIFSENVYSINNGQKDNLTFIIEGTKMYAVGKNNSKKLFLEKRGDKVFSIKKGEEEAEAVFFYEGDKYWLVDEKTGEKGKLIFERKGDVIYQAKNGEMLKAFLVE